MSLEEFCLGCPSDFPAEFQALNLAGGRKRYVRGDIHSEAQARIAELEKQVEAVSKARDHHYTTAQQGKFRNELFAAENQGCQRRIHELKESLSKTEQILAAEAGKRAAAGAGLSEVMKRHYFAGDREVSLFNFAKQQQFSYVRSDIHAETQNDLAVTKARLHTIKAEVAPLNNALLKAGQDKLALQRELEERKKHPLLTYTEAAGKVTVNTGAGLEFTFTEPHSVEIIYQ